MEREDTIKVLSILKAAYPNFYKNMTLEEAHGVVNLWTMHLKNVPVDIVCMAVNKLISTNKFPPSIAEVKDKLRMMYYEAVANLIDTNLDSSKIEELRRIARNCKVVESEPHLISLISERGSYLETHDKQQVNMPSLQTRGQSGGLL